MGWGSLLFHTGLGQHQSEKKIHPTDHPENSIQHLFPIFFPKISLVRKRADWTRNTKKQKQSWRSEKVNLRGESLPFFASILFRLISSVSKIVSLCSLRFGQLQRFLPRIEIESCVRLKWSRSAGRAIQMKVSMVR